MRFSPIIHRNISHSLHRISANHEKLRTSVTWYRHFTSSYTILRIFRDKLNGPQWWISNLEPLPCLIHITTSASNKVHIIFKRKWDIPNQGTGCIFRSLFSIIFLDCKPYHAYLHDKLEIVKYQHLRHEICGNVELHRICK